MGSHRRRTFLGLLVTAGTSSVCGCLGSSNTDDHPVLAFEPLERWLPAEITLFEHQDFTTDALSQDRNDLADSFGIDSSAVHTFTLFGFRTELRSGFITVGEFDPESIAETIEDEQEVVRTGSRRSFETIEIDTGMIALDSSSMILTRESTLRTMLDAYHGETPRLFAPDSAARDALSALDIESHVSYRDVTARRDDFPTLSPVGVTEAIQAERSEAPSTLAAAFESNPSAEIVERIERKPEITHLETTGRVATFQGYVFDGNREQRAPQVDFSFDGDSETLTITHSGGDSFAADRVSFTGSAYRGAVRLWSSLTETGAPSVEAGDSITIGSRADCDCAISPDGGVIRLVYSPEATDRDVTLATFDVPPA
jgi:hypothetical protein